MHNRDDLLSNGDQSSEDLLSDKPTIPIRLLNEFKQNNFLQVFKPQSQSDIFAVRLQVPTSTRSAQQNNQQNSYNEFIEQSDCYSKVPVVNEYVLNSVFVDTIHKLQQRINELEDRVIRCSKLQVTSNSQIMNDNSMQFKQDEESRPGSRCTQNAVNLIGADDISEIGKDKKNSPINRGQNKPKTPVSPAQTRKSQTPQREEFMLNKMAIIDKKFKALEEKFNKQMKENEIVKKKQDNKIDDQVKKISEIQEKQKKYINDTQARVEEQSSNQKKFLQHLHALSMEISQHTQIIDQLKETPDTKVIELQFKFEKVEENNNQLYKLFQEYQQLQTSQDNDIIQILRNYKDVLQETNKLKISYEELRILKDHLINQ